MKIRDKLDELIALVAAARSLPMSSSVVINKAELTRLLDELRELLPEDVVAAHAILERQDAILTDAVASAERLLTAAADERRKLVSETEVVREARIEAAEMIQAAREQSEQMTRDVDGYVDAKLAHLEVSVTKLLDNVRQGRERLAQPELYAELSTSLEAAAPPDAFPAVAAGNEAVPAEVVASSDDEPPVDQDAVSEGAGRSPSAEGQDQPSDGADVPSSDRSGEQGSGEERGQDDGDPDELSDQAAATDEGAPPEDDDAGGADADDSGGDGPAELARPRSRRLRR